MANAHPALLAQGLGKVFYRKQAPPLTVLNQIDLRVERGQTIAILGKSGAGKSTLLHTLGTLERPTYGRCEILGRSVIEMRDEPISHLRNREIGFVFQFHHLLIEFTALENVAIPVQIAGKDSATAQQRARELLDRVGLSHRLRHRPGQLSGGEQQRVAIARALACRPSLLFTDEMTGNLDPQTGMNVFALVQELQRELNMALVSVTHDAAMAQSYQQVLYLENGILSPWSSNS